MELEDNVVQKKGFKLLNLVGFTVDETQPLALFREKSGESTYPLWLSMADVMAITVDLVANRLPATGERNDFLDSLLQVMGLEVTGISVSGTAGGGYTASVCLTGGGRLIEVNVAPATALLTAIRYKLPVMVSEDALASSFLVDKRQPGNDGDDTAGKFINILENLTPEEMGKYPM